MALPAGLSSFQLTFGQYTDLLGNVVFSGMTGLLTISTPLAIPSTGAVIEAPVSVTIDGNGTATLGPLPHTDDPLLFPLTAQYTLTWNVGRFAQSPGNKIFTVPRSMGSVVDFDLLNTGYTPTPPTPTGTTALVGSAVVGTATVG